jgi:hypothetical protein
MSVLFQASLTSNVTNSTDVVATNNCQTLQIGDDSNYYQATENACGAALFNIYRTFTVQYYQGSVYNLSSITNPPTCTAAYNGTNPVVNITTGDGWYTVVLNTIPTWNIGSTYLANTHQVYNPHDGLLYSCITNNTGAANTRPDITPLDWQVFNYTASTTIAAQVYSKYSATSYFALMCNSMVALPQLINNALCVQGLNCNNATLCNNDSFINAMKCLMLIYSVQNANSLNQLQFTTNQFDLLNSLIGCNTPQ